MRFSNFFPSFLFRSLLFPSFSNAAAFSPSHFSAYSHIYFSLIRMSRYFPTFAAILLHKVFEDSIPNDSSSVFIICVQGYDACLALVPHSTFVFVDASQMWAIIRNTHDMHLQWKDYSVVQSCFEVHRTACEPSLARKEWRLLLIDAYASGELLSKRSREMRPRRSCEDTTLWHFSGWKKHKQT